VITGVDGDDRVRLERRAIAFKSLHNLCHDSGDRQLRPAIGADSG
jgi:hypothetical protein